MKYFLITLFLLVGCSHTPNIEVIKIISPQEKEIDLGVRPKKSFSFKMGYNSVGSVEKYDVETDLLILMAWRFNEMDPVTVNVDAEVINLERHEPYTYSEKIDMKRNMCSELIWTFEEDHIVLYISSIVMEGSCF
jgi:hypothetical protein